MKNQYNKRQLRWISHSVIIVKTISKVFFLFLSISIFAQRENDKVYVSIPYDVEGEYAPEEKITEKSFFWGSSFDYVVYEFSNILRENLNNIREQQRMEYAKRQSLTKLAIIKNQYSEYENYPSTIIDGWHSAIATDNLNFCKDVKVLVKNNRIRKFIIDNYIPINFTATREIKNAKNVITLQNFNNEQLNIVEVYFLYDIDEQIIVSKPINPGYVCFWTDSKNFDHIRLEIDNTQLEGSLVSFPSRPDCFTHGTICRILKPGIYSFLEYRKGKDFKGSFEIKENMCLQFHLR